MRVLVTRPEPEARALAARLKALGHKAILSPALAIEPIPDAVIPARAYRAVLVTSANASRALRGRLEIAPLRDSEFVAVGARAAEEARAAGFTRVTVAGGDADALAAHVLGTFSPSEGPLLYLAGTERASDLDGRLRREGFSVDLVEIYRARPIETLAPEAGAALRAGAIDAVLLMSRRTAQAFLAGARAAGLEDSLRGVTALTLSPAVAKAAADGCFSAVRIANAPDEEALLACLATGAPLDDSSADPGASRAREDDTVMAERTPGRGGKRRAPVIEGRATPVEAQPEPSVPTPEPNPPAPEASPPVEASTSPQPTPSPEVSPPSEPPIAAVPPTEAPSEPAPAMSPSPWRPAVIGGLAGGALVLVLLILASLAGLVGGTDRAIVTRLDALERSASDARGDIDRLRAALRALESRVAALAAQPAPNAQASGADPAELESIRREVARLGELAAGLDARLRRIDLAPLSAAHAQLRAELDRLLAQGQAARRSEAAAGLALANLRLALDRGTPFRAELDALRGVPGADAPLNALAAKADTGVPGSRQLLEKLRIHARAMIEATEPAPTGAWERVTGALGRLVHVRPTGERAGDGPAAMVARLEARLARGDIAGAATEFDALPAPAKAAGAAFATDLAARLDGERQLRALAEALAKAGQTGN